MKIALKHHIEIGDKRGEAIALQTLGGLCINDEKQLHRDDTESLLQNALVIYRELNDCLGEASILQLIGTMHQRRGRLDAAESALKHALQLYPSTSNRRGTAKTLNRLGVVYRELDRKDEARRVLTEALELSATISYAAGQGNACRNMGLLHRDNEEFDEAEDCLRRAQRFFEQIHHSEKIKTITRDLDIIFALRLHQEVEPGANSHSDPETMTLRRSRASSSDASSVASQGVDVLRTSQENSVGVAILPPAESEGNNMHRYEGASVPLTEEYVGGLLKIEERLKNKSESKPKWRRRIETWMKKLRG